MLERAAGPFVTHERLVIELDQKAARIQAAIKSKFAERHCAAYLPRVAVNEMLRASLTVSDMNPICQS